MIFVNLAVKDVQRSMQFFQKLGFDNDPRFSDENAVCVVIQPDAAYLMLLAEPFFQGFTKRKICDTSMQTEALIALDCESRAAVDAMVKTAVASGGSHAMDPQDHGFMYGWSFYDPDGHHFEVLWMDMSQVPAAPAA